MLIRFADEDPSQPEDFGKPSYLKKLGLSLAHNENGEPMRRIHVLDTNERTIAEALMEAGYFTAPVGKWYCGKWLPEHLPTLHLVSESKPYNHYDNSVAPDN